MWLKIFIPCAPKLLPAWGAVSFIVVMLPLPSSETLMAAESCLSETLLDSKENVVECEAEEVSLRFQPSDGLGATRF